MRIAVWVAIGLACAVPARAQLNTFYSGTQDENGRPVPISARYTVERGRVAMVLKGARSTRMLFLEKQQVLRIVDDSGKTYIDLDREAMKDVQAGMSQAMAQMQQQLGQLPPEQRARIEKSIQRANAAASDTSSVRYVRSAERQTVHGYPCTRVDIVRGGQKVAEYWGTASPDFRLDAGEQATMVAMQDHLRDFIGKVGPAGGGGASRAFQWDARVGGYPLISRCFDGERKILDLHLDSVDRKPPPAALFDVPADYTRQVMSARPGAPERGRDR